ncbi:hypothetical protein A1O1_03170 [Capronia coronata CBS 617.96]|uniref:Large ribosomal subunit protein mL49 n=1 Tax=Capronia coronata CBS 617.96 TaxID=1182541 RepID=W9YPA6_9EURO|nr:uncharacterized protein A1O1_03170 [Capronia coronata CBS 617.96]EXJ94772.1 hypothetical protein A1O1_03170 [Capronia coronata CBS 617.96]
MRAPSTLLLRALLRPQQPLCQIRSKSNWMPREKYAKITLLDKLHRRQKEALRKERQSSQVRAQKMTTESLPDPPPSQIQHPVSTQTGPSPTISLLPFKINRTPSSNLPIYQSSKAGGSKHITSIRKITGDLNELAARIRIALGLHQHVVDVKGRRKETVAINWTTKQVVVRGWRGPEIKKWAELNGF